MPICTKCGNDFPLKRKELGYKECVECSTQQKWSGAQVVHHKTGNEVEIIKDPEVAQDFEFKSRRKGFGTLQGMTSKRIVVTRAAVEKEIVPPPPPSDKILQKRKVFISREQEEETAARVFETLDVQGAEKAIELLNREFQALKITAQSRKAILALISK